MYYAKRLTAINLAYEKCRKMCYPSTSDPNIRDGSQMSYVDKISTYFYPSNYSIRRLLILHMRDVESYATRVLRWVRF